jgi:hypothetical protein
MCGHVGVVGDIGFPEKKAFNGLLLTDQVRGMDGTGIITVGGHNANVVKTFKKALPSHEVMQYSQYATLLGNTSLKVLAGHNRHATKGDPTKHHYAHPFTHGDITLLHNGTLTDQTNLPNHTEFEVDSENICYALSIEEPSEVIGRLKGAFTLIWWDARDDSINFCRNSQRPLYFRESTDGTKMFWASECWMLNGFLSQERTKQNDVYSKATYAEIGTHYKICLPKTMRFNQVLEMTQEAYELYKAPVVTYNNTTHRSTYNHTLNYKHVKEFAVGTGIDLSNVRFWLQGFLPYKPNDKTLKGKGTLLGRVAGPTNTQVKVQGCSRQEYETFVRDNELLLSAPLQSMLTEKDVYVNNFSYGNGKWEDYTLMLMKCDLVDADVLEKEDEVNDSLAIFVSGMTTTARSNYINKVDVRRELEKATADLFVDANNTLVEYKVVLADANKAKGCIMCSTIPSKDEFHDIIWYGKESFICGTCVSTQMT